MIKRIPADTMGKLTYQEMIDRIPDIEKCLASPLPTDMCQISEEQEDCEGSIKCNGFRIDCVYQNKVVHCWVNLSSLIFVSCLM